MIHLHEKYEKATRFQLIAIKLRSSHLQPVVDLALIQRPLHHDGWNVACRTEGWLCGPHEEGRCKRHIEEIWIWGWYSSSTMRNAIMPVSIVYELHLKLSRLRASEGSQHQPLTDLT